MSNRHKEKPIGSMTHREKVERAIVNNKQMQRIFNPLVDKVKASYSADTYDSMVDKLSLELSKKGVPFNLKNFERQELTVEGLCQGIWNEENLKLYVEAGLAEDRYDLENFV